MFSKRNRDDADLFEADIDDRRSSFRVSPVSRLPAEMSKDGRGLRIVDIGAGGVAFKNDGFEKGSSHAVVICLPDDEPEIRTDIFILDIDGSGICHCSFKGIREEEADRIHAYMLKVQKLEIRERKTG